MATMKRPRLRSVVALDNYRLRLTFRNGKTYTVSLAGEFDQFPGLEPLRDPQAFAKACIGEDCGWTVEWPDDDIQIGADTLWLEAQAQNAMDDNTRVFAQWRADHGLSLAQAAQALGMTPRTISAYGTGARPVPRYIALACKGYEAEHRR
jgi:DNA-binding XRE family transcriptional regulator